MNRLQRYAQIIALLLAGCVLVVLALRDVQLDRELVMDSKLDRATPYLSTFGPAPRVETDGASVRLIGEPAYVDLRMPRWFHDATIELTYENPSAVPFRLGVRTHPTVWQFDVKTIDGGDVNGMVLERHMDVVSPRDGVVVVPFTFSRSWQDRNVYRLIFSAPGVSEEQPITIRGMRVVAMRAPICGFGFCL
ncbi:MAG: hypothetical protein ABIG71_03645 [Candidatus Uhrbacteria bacterium]